MHVKLVELFGSFGLSTKEPYTIVCSITLHVNCKIAVFQERSSTYHGKDGHKG